jgi:exonuclease VII small subunit
MLVAIFTVLLIHFGAGAGSFSFAKAFEPFLKEAVTEQSRYERAVQLTKEADENFEQFRKEVTEVRAKELKILITDYDATDEQFRQFFEKGSASREAMQQRMLDVRFKMTTVVTKDEWDAVYRKIDQKKAEKK